MKRQNKKDPKVESKEKKKFHLFGFITKIFKPALRVIDTVDSDYRDRSLARKTLIAFLKLKAPICVFLAIVCVLSACYFIFKSTKQSAVIMSLNYEESAKGLNPNATRFNAYDIKSRKNVEAMLEYCGIDPESVDIDEVTNSISINPTNSMGFSVDNLYIATSYRISITQPKCIKSVDADDMIMFLCKAYKDNLYANYTENRSILEYDMGDFDDVEYMEIADIFDLKTMQLQKYLNTRMKQSKTFTDESSDETFKSLSQKVEDMQTYDIANYRAYVLQSGLSVDKLRYTTSLEYVNLIKTLSYHKDIAAYEVRNDGIIMYNEAMISIVMIPSVDRRNNNYYMSKTKTGMDYMASQADDYLLTAQDTSKEIATNEDIISKMRAGTNALSYRKKADNMIENIRLKFAELSKQVETIDKAYVTYKTKDYVTFKVGSKSLMQMLQPDMIAALVIVIAGGLFGLIWLRFRYLNGGGKN